MRTKQFSIPSANQFYMIYTHLLFIASAALSPEIIIKPADKDGKNLRYK